MNACQHQVISYVLDLPVYNIWILTSLAFGGATSICSILRGSPAPQQTAALHLIVVPAVDDIWKKILLKLVVVKVKEDGNLDNYLYRISRNYFGPRFVFLLPSR